MKNILLFMLVYRFFIVSLYFICTLYYFIKYNV